MSVMTLTIRIEPLQQNVVQKNDSEQTWYQYANEVELSVKKSDENLRRYCLHVLSKSKDWKTKQLKRFGSRNTKQPKHYLGTANSNNKYILAISFCVRMSNLFVFSLQSSYMILKCLSKPSRDAYQIVLKQSEYYVKDIQKMYFHTYLCTRRLTPFSLALSQD